MLPKADNLIFWENKEGRLHFGKVVQDDAQEADKGYSYSTTGDSGGGYFLSSKVDVKASQVGRISQAKSEERQTVIGVHSEGTPPTKDHKLFESGIADSCPMRSSKLTGAVTAWLKEVDNDDTDIEVVT